MMPHHKLRGFTPLHPRHGDVVLNKLHLKRQSAKLYQTQHLFRDVTGFTLIEVLIVTAIFSIILGMGLIFSFNFYQSYLLNTERDLVLGTLTKARSRALSNMFETSHGVHVEGNAYIIFRGDSYNPSDPSNEIIPGNNAIQKNGIEDIVFSELTGVPNVTGDLTLSEGGKSKIISINNEGRIDW